MKIKYIGWRLTRIEHGKAFFAIRFQWENPETQSWFASRGITIETHVGHGGFLWQHRGIKWQFVGTAKSREKIGKREGFIWE